MGHIFICYSRRDQEIVDRIVGAMEQAGLNVWMDRENIEAGKLWRAQIVEAVDTSDAVVLMLSPNSMASSTIRKEVDLAEATHKDLVPMVLAPVKLPAQLRYQLAGLRSIELHVLGFDKAVDQLIETLKAPKPIQEQSLVEFELVIKGINTSTFDADKQEQLRNFISDLINTKDIEISILDANKEEKLPSFVSNLVNIQGIDIAAFDAKIQEQLRDFISNLVNVPKSQLAFSTVLAGDLTTDAPPPKPKKKRKAK